MLAQPVAAAQQYRLRIPVHSSAAPSAVSGDLLVSPAQIAFGATAIGTAAAPATLTVLNGGPGPVRNISISLPGGAGDFIVVSNTCPSNLAALASCSVVVGFLPSSAVVASRQIAVSSTARNGIQLISVSGTSLSPDVALSQAPFAPVQVGESVATSVTLSNHSSTPVNISLPSLATPFSVSTGTCSAVLPAGASCVLTAAFRPESAGSFSSPLEVGLTAGAFAFSRSVDLQGSASAQAATLSVDPFGSVPSGTAKSVAATLRNTGIGSLAVGTPLVSGQGFEMGASDCVATLAAGRSCTVTVRMNATGTAAYSGSLVIPTGAGEKIAALGGQSIAAALTVSSDSAGFGAVQIGETASSGLFTLTNAGNAPAVGLTVSTAAPFMVGSNSCSSTLAAGESCSFSVLFSPSAAGYVENQVRVSFDGAVNALVIAASGSGVGQSVAVQTSPAVKTLADWYGPGVVTETVTYRNDGKVAMTLQSPTLSAPLAITSNTCTNVVPGGACSLTVALARDGTTGGSGTQTFTPAGADVGPSSTEISWSVYAAVPRWTTTAMNFVDTKIGQTVVNTNYLFNDGNVAYNWAANSALINLPAGFTADTSACGNVLPTKSCAVKVTFAPTAATLYYGSGITMASGSRFPNTFTVQGRGQPVPSLSYEVNGAFAPTTIYLPDFHDTGASYGPTVRMLIRSTGTASVTGLSPTVTNSHVVINNCPTTLAPGAECEIFFATKGGLGGNPREVIGTLTVATTNVGNRMYNLRGKYWYER